MSVVIARADRDPQEVLQGHPGFGLVELGEVDLEALGQEIVSDPLPQEPDHALVVGDKPKGVQRNIAKAAHWVVRPPDQSSTT